MSHPAGRPDGDSAQGAPAAVELENRRPFPWEEPLSDASSSEAAVEEDAASPRQRHDAFTEARKTEYLKALVKTGCLDEACRRTGVSRRTVYRHQEGSPSFFDNCCLALKMAATPLELTAWKRAVEGIEEEVVVGGKIVRRTRYSEGLLRVLLQGANPRKYGSRPGFKRKRLLKHEKKQMEREIRAEIKAETEANSRTFEEAVQSVLSKIEAIERHSAPEKFAAGWTKSPDDHWIPPGYGPLPDSSAPGAAAEAGGTADDAAPHESV